MRVKVILNPWSDRGNAVKVTEQIKTLGAQYGQLDLETTSRPGHATQLAAEALDAGYDLIVAAGGDGTVHEVSNGLVHGGRSQATMGVIPIGSGNDFAYALKIPTRLEEAVNRLFTGERRQISLARIEDDKGRFSIVANGIGIGFDATISIESRNITRIHGFAMYLLATLRTIAFYYQTPNFEVQFDGETIQQKVLLLALGVGPRAGGGFLLTPEATHFDNLLDSCTVDPVKRLTMLRVLTKVMKGSHTNLPFVTMRRNQYINIKSDQPLPIHTDGEIFAYPEDQIHRVTITSLPDALAVMI
jgi:YegS/Rv2252/BmrU family lipid kinase